MFTFAKEFSTQTITAVENEFITKYLFSSEGDAVRVYLYGLFLCNHPEQEDSFSNFCEKLNLDEKKVFEYLNYWEDFGLITILSKDPVNIQYLPVRSATNTKPRKIKAEKYSEFTKGIQALFSNKMISVGEYSEYFSIMETYGISPDAMLLIANYCVDLKGQTISYKYISAVAKDFANRGIISIEKVENELSTYVSHTSEIAKVLKALSLKRRPDVEDLTYYDKWIKTFCFDPENIVYAAKVSKKNSIKKLDDFLSELFAMKCLSKEEIATYTEKKQRVYDLTLKINKALSIYVEVLETEINNYVNPWLAYGFSDDSLLYIANTCFKEGKNNLIEMNERVENLRNLGYIDLTSINDYFNDIEKSNQFINKMLITCGLSRRATPWDRENLTIWKNWKFTEEMILEAAKIACGKSSPIAYINGVLSNWKNNEIYTVNEISENEKVTFNSQDEYNREYENRRAKAISIAQKNLDKAFDLEGFSPIYERLNGIEKDLAFAEISGNKDREIQLEEEKANLICKANDLLSAIKLSLDDLSPKFACEKCQDTGYVGTQRCDCLKKKK